MINKTDFIQANPLGQGLMPDVLTALAQRLFEKKQVGGAIILCEGDPAESLYFIAEGVVKIFKTSADGKEQILALLHPGDYFNDVPVLDDGPSPASAQAMGPGLLLGLSKADLTAIINLYPPVALNLLKVMTRRIRDLIDLVEDLSFRSVAGRVAKILLDGAGRPAQPGPRLTQRDMAAMAGTAREVVSRSLKYLEDEDLIEMRRHRIVIKDQPGLKQLVETGV
jgi:CRP/FNR family transcriptional regulator, cyclic AMP receptor protein